MQFEVHVDPEVIFIPIVGSLLAAQVAVEDNDITKVHAISAIRTTMKAED
jgi:hypothetical protein